MKKHIVLYVAALLLLLKCASITYGVVRFDKVVRHQIGMFLAAAIFAGMALVLYLRPEIGRWPAGIYYVLATWLCLGFTIKPDITINYLAFSIGNAVLNGWLAYALLGGKKMKEYLRDDAKPHQL